MTLNRNMMDVCQIKEQDTCINKASGKAFDIVNIDR